ncbi:DUF4760 domain-containing protein [Psychromarinibacter sp. C21-152]|uniref:DUF4760 domain-containing protein n=1 Tax=Psychromarinibacter sediminicola TaxID=3033385 RepID=A0AAE3NKI0_9RHOB|nr:DUF4760 domain-containing protein [Psychromarinibacter sediminicola]MDF0599568.1 DUF4760 domain-containing protein [Psychromarinibacter sediminicola]
MQWIDLIADISTVAAALAVIVTTVFVWRQVGLQRTDVDTEVRRLQRESLATIHEALQDEKFRDARAEFFAGPHQRAYDDLSDVEKRRARFILAVYTLLARMVESGAIDEGLYRDYWRGTLLRDWARLENFVAGERLGTRNHGLFTGTERLAESWSKADA